MGRAILTNPFLAKSSASQFALLSDEAYARGVERIEQSIRDAESAGTELVFDADLTMFLLTAARK